MVGNAEDSPADSALHSPVSQLVQSGG